MSAFDPTVTYKPVPGYEGYLVGDDGSVWSCKSNSGKLTDRWKRLTPQAGRGGYLRVCITPLTGQPQLVYVSRLVLEAFVGPCPLGMEACHENDDRTDNRLSNLKWDTKQNNIAQRNERGRTAKGERSGKAKLKAADIPGIFILSALGFSHPKIAKMVGVSEGAIADVLSGRNWKHASPIQNRRTQTGRPEAR